MALKPKRVPALDPKMPDAELAERVANREEAAFRLLMRRHNQLLFRTARSIFRDDAEAEDALQEAYIQAYNSIGTFRGEAKLSTWLVRIVVNVALGRLRKNRRGAEIIAIDSEAAEAHVPEEADLSPENETQPEREALRAQTRRIIERKIDELPEAFRTVFVLRAVEEMSVEEAAEALAIPEATVRSRLFRARGLLRASLSQEIDVAIDEAFSFDGARCDRIIERVIARIK
jgi:RNA polymerase sigma-70 factor (ECF subfamily)